MGNREALLAGAKRCLNDKGYTRTTARDIASASGVSLAAIGYHFGSKEALLQEALFQAMDEWGAEVGQALAAGDDADSGPRERFVDTWRRAIESFGTHRALWLTQFELISQIDHLPELRKAVAGVGAEGREGLAELFHGGVDGLDEKTVQLLGSFYQALLVGMVAMWLFDPEMPPSGEQLAEALRMVAARLEADR